MMNLTEDSLELASPNGRIAIKRCVDQGVVMTKEMFVQLVGQAHKDAQELLWNSRAGVAEYIARPDGSILTVNRQQLGVLSQKLYRHPKKKQVLGYKDDVLKETKKISRKSAK